MAISLRTFSAEMRQRINRFEAWWKDQHDKDPDHFPLEFEEGNEGMWWEQFSIFDEEV